LCGWNLVEILQYLIQLFILFCQKNAITRMRELNYKVIQVDMNLLDECMLNKCKSNAWIHGIQKRQLISALSLSSVYHLLQK